MARVYGSSKTEYIEPKVSLLSYSTDPVGTVASMWIGSRHNKSLYAHDLQYIYDVCDTVNPENEMMDQLVISKLREMYPEYAELPGREIVARIVKMVDDANLPPLDAINFTFQIDDATVAFREQLVRSRLPQNFWTQTSRTADLTQMDVNMMESVSAAGPEAEDIYKSAVSKIRRTYEELIDLGVPSEDIRLMPSNMTHRIYWMVSYRTLKSSLSKRLSWIAQSGLWSPIILGIMKELRKVKQLEPFTNSLSTPSDIVIRNGEIISHRYDIENEDRYYGRDPLPVDPLWLAYRNTHGDILSYPELRDPYQYLVMKRTYSQLWSDEILDILDWHRDDVLHLGNYDPFISSDIIHKYEIKYVESK